MDVAAIFTTLLPTKIELSNFLGWSINFSNTLAPFTPFSFRCLILTLLTDITAVSDAEKNADIIINPIKTRI